MGVRFRRVAEAFEEAVRTRQPCESSGSEHSPETLSSSSSVDLSDLVNSFMERESKEVSDEREANGDSELRDALLALLGCREDDDEERRNIRVEVEEAYQIMGDCSSPEIKRRLMMARLRKRGFDAGFCKSKWERTRRFPSGSHDYIDLNLSGTRYIIEVNLACEFEIARPTETYTSLLQLFPPIFVGKAEELKLVVRLMCNAIKGSMNSVGMHVPPWRRFGYVQAKWFGSYKRTINELSVKKSSNSGARKRSIGFFAPLPEISYKRREDFHFVSKAGLRVGQLALVLDGNNMLI